jgi:lysophospholipase L1-like esterase
MKAFLDSIAGAIRRIASVVGNVRRGEAILKRALLAIVLSGFQFGCATNQQPAKDLMPAFFDGARILFQGDSITDGNRGRNSDPNHILGHGYQFIIAAKYGDDLANRNLTFINRGLSGNKVSDLARRWQTDTIDLKPDLLSILVGVNDLNYGAAV